MDRGAWRATVQGHKESDTTEETSHACTVNILGFKAIPSWSQLNTALVILKQLQIMHK